MLDYHRAIVMTQVNHLNSTLKMATQIHDKIRIIENNPAHLTKKDIDTVLKNTEEQISAALKIASKINEILQLPDYLDRNQIQILQEQVSMNINYVHNCSRLQSSF